MAVPPLNWPTWKPEPTRCWINCIKLFAAAMLSCQHDSHQVAAIKKAIAEGETVYIAYQSLVDRLPYWWREVFPLRLEQQGELYYLHGY